MTKPTFETSADDLVALDDAKTFLEIGPEGLLGTADVRRITEQLADLRDRLKRHLNADAPSMAGLPARSNDLNGALAETLKAFASSEVPVIVATNSEIAPVQLQVSWPVPEGLFPPECLWGLPTETRALIAGSDDLAQHVRNEAEAAGVRVIASPAADAPR